MPLNLHKLFIDVLDPQTGETALVLVDMPGALDDTPEWAARRAMAERWHAALVELGAVKGFTVLPLVRYAATNAHSAQLPAIGEQEGATVDLEQLAAGATIILALTEFSASAPLIGWTRRYPRLRAISMPTVAPEMEETALAADYEQVARSCATLRGRLAHCQTAFVAFSNGDALTLDLRWRQAYVDDGRLPLDKEPPRLVNLPSGESYCAVYEGEHPGEPSQTAGVLPVPWEGSIVRLRVEANHVVEVLGNDDAATSLHAFLQADPARANIAELGLGCNPQARVWGNVLEDEKAGLHIALGRSDHIGGTVGPDDFLVPEHVWHYDIVYARQSSISVSQLIFVDDAGIEETIIRDGRYVQRLEIGM